ncbi:MAG TPA: glutaredoxin family protein [Ktedonobacterales bacterium]|nr:glutaredoxin family protein [Ktedonobacterales bacterium]
MERASTDPDKLKVVFYTKAGCHLCDDARDLLEDLAADIPYELTEIDIRSDLGIFEQYRYRIPVIIINDQTTVEGRIDQSDLLKAFKSQRI